MLLHASDNLVDLELLAVADVPLVDHEEDVPLERLKSRLDDDRLFLLNHGCGFGFLDRGGSRCRRNDHRSRSGFSFAEAEGQTGEGFDLEVSLGTLLGVEVVVDEAGVTLEVESDNIGKTDVE